MTDDRIFRTVAGKEYMLTPVSMDFVRKAMQGTERRMRAEGEPLDVPTYDVEMAGGTKQAYMHDEESIKQRNDPELTELWKRHKTAKAKLSAENGAIMLKAWVLLGLFPSVEAEYNDGKWAETAAKWGVEVPTEEDARKLHFISTEILKTPEDNMTFIRQITLLSGRGQMDEEAVDRLMDLFRGIPQKLSQRVDTTDGTGDGQGRLAP